MAAYNGVNYSPLTKWQMGMYIASNPSIFNKCKWVCMLQAKMDGCKWVMYVVSNLGRMNESKHVCMFASNGCHRCNNLVLFFSSPMVGI